MLPRSIQLLKSAPSQRLRFVPATNQALLRLFHTHASLLSPRSTRSTLEDEDDIFDKKLEKLLSTEQHDSNGSILDEISKDDGEDDFSLEAYLEATKSGAPNTSNAKLDPHQENITSSIHDVFQQEVDRTLLRQSGAAGETMPTLPEDLSEMVHQDRQVMTGIFKDLVSSKPKASPFADYVNNVRSSVAGGASKNFLLEDVGRKPRAEKGAEDGKTLAAKVQSALEPTLKHIKNGFQTDYDLVEFLQRSVIDQFESLEIAEEPRYKVVEGQIEAIAKQSRESPGEPLVNDYTFAALLRAGFDTLYGVFGSPSALDDIITLFDAVKSSPQPEKVVAGLDTAVYNVLLAQTWAQHRDLHRTQRLLLDMKVNGVLADAETAAVLDTVYREARQLLNEDPAQQSDTDQARLDSMLNAEFLLPETGARNTKFWNEEDVGRFKVIEGQYLRLLEMER